MKYMAKYKILVDEPWDYKGPAGQNLIVGEIVKVYSPYALLFKSDHSLNFDGLSGNLLILLSRYEKQSLDIKNDNVGTVGGGLLFSDDYEGKSAKYLEENSSYVLIGGLYRVGLFESF